MKPAKVGREKPWHQDSVYWPWQPMDLVSAGIALDDSGPENGCLQVIPGTHTEQVQHYGQEKRFYLTPEQHARTRYVPLQAGDALLLHSLLWHASEPNRSPDQRRLCIFAYLPSHLRYIGSRERPPTIVVSRRAEYFGSQPRDST